MAGLQAPKIMHGQFRNSPERQSEPAVQRERERLMRYWRNEETGFFLKQGESN